MLFIWYEKCSTCQKAKKHLDELEIEVTTRPIKEKNPSADEIKKWSKLGHLPIDKFFNTSGLKYKELGLASKKQTMNEEEKAALLASDGMLVKRPILVGKDFVLLGYKKEQYDELKKVK